jgi:hypothetical protein
MSHVDCDGERDGSPASDADDVLAEAGTFRAVKPNDDNTVTPAMLEAGIAEFYAVMGYQCEGDLNEAISQVFRVMARQAQKDQSHPHRNSTIPV